MSNSPRPILITGFEPFAGRGRNPSGEIVRAIGDAWQGKDLVAEVLPVEYAAAGERLQRLIREWNPRAWLGFGLHQKATAIVLERIAFNLDDATIPDNAGELRRGLQIQPDGPDCYRSTLPLGTIESRLAQENIPLTHSDSAGRFVCNHVFYRGLSALSETKSGAPAGFIHLPWPCDWPSAERSPHSVTFMRIRQAVELCASTVLQQTPTQKIVAT